MEFQLRFLAVVAIAYLAKGKLLFIVIIISVSWSPSDMDS